MFCQIVTIITGFFFPEFSEMNTFYKFEAARFPLLSMIPEDYKRLLFLLTLSKISKRTIKVFKRKRLVLLKSFVYEV